VTVVRLRRNYLSKDEKIKTRTGKILVQDPGRAKQSIF